MKANPILLHQKYARVVERFAEKAQIDYELALDVFYCSNLYHSMREGDAEMHSRSDEYLAQQLMDECVRR
ncbi:MAG: DUF3791 domain-containing protein [Bacillota bacterium]|nr:DUF3791 domain-containing protein [Bacillota bacterium]